jgi:diguanylate cyclase (GGDEF)-like protein
MNNSSQSDLSAEFEIVPFEGLTRVLEQSEHVNEVIRLSAEELSSVNTGIKQELATRGSPPGLEDALEKNEAIRLDLQHASEELTVVNQALMEEVRARTMVDHQLAAAIEQEEGARNVALHDILTGLPNRMLFDDRLQHGIAQATRHHWTLAVMFVDLDNFKTINDTYGHEAGDALLQIIATRLKQNTRHEDTISRFGGDEFLCLLTQIHDHKDIAMIAAKILNAIQAPCNLTVCDVIVNPCVNASIGIAVFPGDGDTADALIRRADEAMYVAKENNSGYAFAQQHPAGFFVRNRTDTQSAMK